ncbi:unnamed protein product [Dovyalis caffra]|uniref:Uncharacterized protein n=1 Tax=Dovyalis caffra TaxID=77055 RepID=A0AAV1RQ30_9ROSI|nr:unnamed protein product [Dovyalis caffra]
MREKREATLQGSLVPSVSKENIIHENVEVLHGSGDREKNHFLLLYEHVTLNNMDELDGNGLTNNKQCTLKEHGKNDSALQTSQDEVTRREAELMTNNSRSVA